VTKRRDPRDRPTAHRPLRKEGRRALSHVGGPIESSGDSALAARLAEALSVRSGERDATLTHPFHAYPARLHPETARRLVACAIEKHGAGSVVLDPCCGSGTVLVEAEVSGLAARGTDLSPLAVELARIKTRLTTASQRKDLIEGAHAVSRRAAERVRARERLPVPSGEAHWFAPHTLREVSALAATIALERDPFLRDAYRMLLSSILVKTSYQRTDSDPRRVIKPIGPGNALHWFARKSLELSRGLDALARSTPRGATDPVVQIDDATSLSTIADASVHAVITSPPYAATYDYVVHHTRRYAWLGLDASALEAGEIGAARWFDVPEVGLLRFAREMSSMMRAVARVLVPGGEAFLVLADGAAGDEPIFADRAVTEAIRGTPLRQRARASQARPAFDPVTARAFAKRAKREHLVALVRE
jgi:hypothetical protein